MNNLNERTEAPTVADNIARFYEGQRAKHSTTIFPSFYAVVHRVWNERAQHNLTGGWHRNGQPTIRCAGAESPYEPDQHVCYDFASILRVELHAAGIRLSNDGDMRSIDPLPFGAEYDADSGMFVDTSGRGSYAPRYVRMDRSNSRRTGPDAEDRVPLDPPGVIDEGELRRRLALAESVVGDPEDDEPVRQDAPSIGLILLMVMLLCAAVMGALIVGGAV